MRQHLSEEELQRCVDTSIEPGRRNEIDLHIRNCPGCRSRFQAAQRLDMTLRQIPLDSLSVDFTERVVRRLGLKETPSFAWVFARNLAPVLGLTLVVGALVIALNYAGGFHSSGIQETVTTGQSIYHSMAEKTSGGISAFNSLLTQYLPFAFARDAYSLTTFLIAFFGAIALLDKFIFAPMLRRRS